MVYTPDCQRRQTLPLKNKCKFQEVIMKKISGVFYSGKNVKYLVFSYIFLSLLGGFVILSANENIAALFNNHLMVLGAEGFYSALLLTVSLFAALFLLSLLSEYILHTILWRGEERLKGYFIRRLLRAKSAYFYDKQAPELWSNINMSTQMAAGFFSTLLQAVSTIIMLGFYGAIIFSIDITAGILSLAAIPFYMLLTKGVGRNFESMQHGIMANHRELSVVAQEAITNASNVKVKNAYDFFVKRVISVQSKITVGMRKFNVLQSYLNSVIATVSIIAPIIIIFTALQLSSTLVANIGVVLILYINIPRFLASFGSLYSHIIRYRSSKPALATLKELSAIELEPEGGKVINSFESLESSGVKVDYGNGRVIEVPDVVILRGEKVMFFGESGAGKSTLFNIVMGLNDKYEGIVRVNGIDIREIELASLRNVFGIAFQGGQVLTLNLKDNMLIGREGLDFEVEKIMKISNLGDLSDSKAEETIYSQTVSGGEKSRIGLAQTLIGSPAVLLIDETFSNVDEGMEELMLNNLMKEYPEKTILCISHRTSSKRFFSRNVEFTGEAA